MYFFNNYSEDTGTKLIYTLYPTALSYCSIVKTLGEKDELTFYKRERSLFLACSFSANSS